MRLEDQEIIQPSPNIYQEINGVRHQVEGGYTLINKQQVAFHLGDYDTRQPLVIDPVLVWSTYLGGSGNEDVSGFRHNIAIDSCGYVYLTGETDSINFPTQAPGFQLTDPGAPSGNGPDAFVTKLDPTGTVLIYSTYIGGSNASSESRGIAVDTLGRAYITGRTAATTTGTLPFPETCGTTNQGNYDAFVVRLDPSGGLNTNAGAYARFIGGSNFDMGMDIAVNGATAFVTGSTSSSNFLPTPTPSNMGNTDIFVVRLNSNGCSHFYSKLIGGTGGDQSAAIAVRGNHAYITGSTTSTNGNFTPVIGTGGGVGDGFITRLNGGGNLVFSTRVGGIRSEIFNDVAVRPVPGNAGDAEAYVTGQSAGSGLPSPSDFPTTPGAFQTIRVCTDYNGYSAVVARFSPTGGLLYATFLGGMNSVASITCDYGTGIAADRSSSLSNPVVYVVGTTGTIDFPTVSPLLPTTPLSPNNPFPGGANNLGLSDVFLTRLPLIPPGIPIYSTYLGGSNGEDGGDIAVRSGANCQIYVAGRTDSSDFPTLPFLSGVPFAPTFSGGNYDFYVTKIKGC